MNESENLEPQTAAENPNFDSEYLREAVRLAELRMSEQNSLERDYERKAVLMITFCVVIAGYLFAGNWAGWAVLKILPIAFLAVAVWKGVRTFEFKEFGAQGIHPETSAELFELNYNTDLLREYALVEYEDRLNRNGRYLNRRAERLEFAKPYFYTGLIFSLCVALAEKLLPFFI